MNIVPLKATTTGRCGGFNFPQCYVSNARSCEVESILATLDSEY